MPRKGITSDEAGAIRRSALLGRTLQENLGTDLAAYFRANGTYRGAVVDFNIEELYQVTYAVAWNGVRLAISGHNGMCKTDAYSGLIEEDERRKLGIEHKVAYGVEMFKDKRGIHGLSSSQRRRNAIKGGSKGGKTLLETKAGIHGLSEEENVEVRRVATIARGQVPWGEDEMREVYELSQDKKYQRGKYLDGLGLAHYINDKYHEGESIRTSNSVQMAIKRVKKNSKRAQSRLTET